MSVFALITSAAAAAGEAANGAESSGGLPQLDMTWWPSQLFWLALTFGLLYWLMAGKFLPAIGGAIEERRDRIADDLDQASEFKRQAEEAEKAYDKALADAKAKAQAIAADTRARVDEEIAALKTETDEAVEKQITAAEVRISEMKTAASAKVREAAATVAGSIVETLIDEAPTAEAAQNAVNAVAQSREG